MHYDEGSGGFALSFCTATDPTQLYVLEPEADSQPARRTRERVLGLAPELLSAGEDASFDSHDGLRVSRRGCIGPSPELGYDGPRPLVYYVHGGPQGQERPNFAWFSMPLIQILTLAGIRRLRPERARLDRLRARLHEARRQGLGRAGPARPRARDDRDPAEGRARRRVARRRRRPFVRRLHDADPGGTASRALARRRSTCSGPYDLVTFSQRIPETWKPYFALVLGDPEKAEDRDFLVERSPKTHIENIACPLLVIQGNNDPRVVEQESRDLVEGLRAGGKDVDYLVFEDEGHDVLKLPNRVRCYDAIVGFFSEHLS